MTVIANKLLKLVALSLMIGACSTHSSLPKNYIDDEYGVSVKPIGDEFNQSRVPECPVGSAPKVKLTNSTSAKTDEQTTPDIVVIEYECVERDKTN